MNKTLTQKVSNIFSKLTSKKPNIEYACENLFYSGNMQGCTKEEDCRYKSKAKEVEYKCELYHFCYKDVII